MIADAEDETEKLPPLKDETKQAMDRRLKEIQENIDSAKSSHTN